MGLRDHAEYELKKAKLQAAYGGLVEKAVLELIDVFARQGHSGMSAALVSKLFYDLARYQTLTPITDDPAEWIDRSDFSAENGGKPYWQNKRNSAFFSDDGGKTYTDVYDRAKPPKIHKSHPAW